MLVDTRGHVMENFVVPVRLSPEVRASAMKLILDSSGSVNAETKATIKELVYCCDKSASCISRLSAVVRLLRRHIAKWTGVLAPVPDNKEETNA